MSRRDDEDAAHIAAFTAKEEKAMVDRVNHGDPDNPHPFEGLRSMTDKHPRDMTLAELERLPVVNHIFGGADCWYEDGHGTVWHVGWAGGQWVQAYHRGEPPPAGKPKLQARA